MYLAPRAFVQQRQSISITARVIQSIKLLQYGQEELSEFLHEQAERNPVLDVVTAAEVADRAAELKDAPEGRREPAQPARSGSLSVHDRLGGRGSSQASSREAAPNLEDYCPNAVSLREHLQVQVGIAFRVPGDRAIASEIVESLDPDGYLRRDLDEIADFLGVDEARVGATLATVQTFEPTGVGARDLAECLRLQLREGGRLSPAMDTLLTNLKLLADHNFPRLAKLCGVGEADVVAMAKEIRELDPRPGRRFDGDPVLPALPDVLLDFRSDGGFVVELNPHLLPRVLVNRQYLSQVKPGARGSQDARFITDCVREANWLSRNLHQRAETILKVATELVTQQRAFFLHGVEHLKPLCLRDVATAVGVHESTVCRAIANKYMMTNRGMFELRFFFAGSASSEETEQDFASEAIRHKIRRLVEAETPDNVLSDKAIMLELRHDGARVARRTVAQYREMIGIPSSLRRKRQKQAERLAGARAVAR